MKKSERKFKITVCNGYRSDGRKNSKAKTVNVPLSVPKSRIEQFIMHEAEEFEREFQCGYSENADTPFEEYCQKWLTRQSHYKVSTLAGYERQLKVCCDYMGHIALRRIKPLTIEELIAHLREREVKGRPISEKTVQRYLNAVSVVLEDAKRNDIIRVNPVRLVHLAPIERTEQVIPSREEMSRLMAAFQEEAPLFRLFFLLSVTTGCRRGELAALRWSDIQGSCIRISKSRSQIVGHSVIESDTKNHRVRFVPLVNQVRKLLEELRGDRKDGYIFANENGIPLHPDTFSKHFRRILARLGLNPAIHLHSCRHFFASYLLSSGVSNKVTADILGHQDTSFLERTYGHVIPEFNQAVVGPISQMMDCLAGSKEV